MKYHTYLLIINWLISFNTIGSILPTQTVLPRYVRLGQYLLWEFPNSLHPPGEKKEKILTSPSVSFAGLSRSYWFLCPTLYYILNDSLSSGTPAPPTYLPTYFPLLLLFLIRRTRTWYLSRGAWAFQRTDSTSLQPLLLWPDWSPRRRPIVILIALILARDPPAIVAWYAV